MPYVQCMCVVPQFFSMQHIQALPHKWINLMTPDYRDCQDWVKLRCDFMLRVAGSWQGVWALAASDSTSNVEVLSIEKSDTSVVCRAKRQIQFLYNAIAASKQSQTSPSGPFPSSAFASPASPQFVPPSGIPAQFPPARPNKTIYTPEELSDDFEYFYLCAQIIKGRSSLTPPQDTTAAELLKQLRTFNAGGVAAGTRLETLVHKGWLTRVPIEGGHHRMAVYHGFRFTA